MFAVWANSCWLSCCSLGSVAWLLHQSVRWLGFPCMQMHIAFISLLLFSPAMAEPTLRSDVSLNAWCHFIALHSWVLLSFWKNANLLIGLPRTSLTIIFWRIFCLFVCLSVEEWARPEISKYFHQHGCLFFFNYVFKILKLCWSGYVPPSVYFHHCSHRDLFPF